MASSSAISATAGSVLGASILLAGCPSTPTERDDAAVDDAGVVQHDGAPADGGLADAAGCGSCDDGDAATADLCVVDRCEHRLCADDAACDDGDFQTTDRCVLDPATAVWTCGHADGDGNCTTDADCFDDLDCTRDHCGTGNRCRHAWVPGCVGPAAFTLRLCPATASEGGPCEHEASGLTYDCRESDAACADWLHCVGGTFDAHYVRVETVRPGCDAGGCPSTLPSGACTPDLYCDYSPGDPTSAAPGRVYCDCWDRSSATIDWVCTDDEPCPRTPPSDGAPVDRVAVTGSASCPYGDYVCAIDTATWTWSCETQMPTFCPSVAPVTGEACVLVSDCRYYGPEVATDPVTTYRGECRCDGAEWTCSPNEAADCPTEQPNSHGTLDNCSPTPGNGQCWYPRSGELWTRCHCDPPFDPNLWHCETTLHY